jgi:puromycin-sensitive aminopeptidase
MLEMYLGHERFRIGVSHYLKKHAYGNTETNDLWDAIEEIVTADGGEKVPVRKLMDSWIWQKGYPLVSADVQGDSLVLKQQRFSFQADADTSTLWVVPIHVSNAGNESRLLLDQRELRVPLDSPELPVVVNAGGHGFYRVNYSPELLNRLTGATLAALSTLERYQLVDDSWSAVKAGRLEVREFLAFLDGYKAESDLAVWQTIGTALNLCARVIPPTELGWFAQRVSDLTNQVRSDLGWEPKPDEPATVRQLRGYLVTLAGNLGNDQAVISRCRELWRSIQDSGASVDPELMAAVVGVVAFNGDAVTYDEIRGLYLSAQTPQDEIRYLYALGAFNDASLIARTCEFAFTEDVRAQDAPFLLNRTMNNRLHGHIAWTTIRSRWEEANQKFPINSIIRMVSPVSSLTDPQLVDDVEQFFTEHDIPQATLTLRQTLEMQRVNAALRARTVASW